MGSLEISECIQMVNGIKLQGPGTGIIQGVITDSRKKQEGCLFVPLIGERYDAHEFVPQAIENGAIAVFWKADHPLPENADANITFIGVNDTLEALQQLAKGYRQTLSVTVIGVTGSNGKTSTKDMIAAVLQGKYIVQKTEGNLNNHIGVPLTLLNLEPTTQYAVIEMGMSDLGEIRFLCEMAKPQFGVITNIGEAHLEHLGSREKIAQAKFELVESLPTNGKAILQGDEVLLRSLAPRSQAPVLWFGFEEENDIQGIQRNGDGINGSTFKIRDSDVTFHLPVPGVHQISNALAAIAIGRMAGLTDEQIAAGLAHVSLSAMRLEVHPGLFGGYVINDAYNASPTSMRAALHTLAETSCGDLKVAVLGDMLELGTDARQLHREVGKLAAKLGIDYLLAIGSYATDMKAGALDGGMAKDKVMVKSQGEDVLPQIKRWLKQAQEPVVLVKASRGMRLETIARALI